MRRFTPIELHTYLQQPEAAPLLLDVREPWEYEKCRIEGSQLVPMREVPQQAEQWDANQEIVVICHHGIRSRQVGLFLEQQGFDKIINLEGGVEAWAQDIDPNMNRY